jgi:hypothetical protein
MLRGEDFHDALVDEAALAADQPDLLAGPFAHIVVDEAQELTDAEWQMLLLRCPSRSFTIVGDRAQARHGFTESWQERLERIGLDRITLASLSINYRTPAEVMAEAEPVIRAALPDANVPGSIRSSGIPVMHGPASDLGSILDAWLAAHAEGIACVIDDSASQAGRFRATSRVRSLTPELSKGLEFDLVVLVDPEAFGTGIEGAVDRYVAMTRATQQLVILTGHGQVEDVITPAVGQAVPVQVGRCQPGVGHGVDLRGNSSSTSSRGAWTSSPGSWAGVNSCPVLLSSEDTFSLGASGSHRIPGISQTSVRWIPNRIHKCWRSKSMACGAAGHSAIRLHELAMPSSIEPITAA